MAEAEGAAQNEPALHAKSAITRPAPAKINLALHVTGRRADGYHLLDSLVVFADIGDTLTVAPREPALGGGPVRLLANGPFADQLPPPAQNIVAKAAAAIGGLRPRRDGEDQAIEITLAKMLPCAAGLGGGSADAAATLNALCEFWQLAPDADGLDELARGLGADVPVCLSGRPQRLRGIGEKLDPVRIDFPFAALLANPGRPCPTARVFDRLTNWNNDPLPALPDRFTDLRQLLGWLDTTRNDLAIPALTIAPEIASVLDQLNRLDGCLLARMTGSGSTCFALFGSDGEAKNAAAGLHAAHRDWWITATVLNPAVPI
jgi:4-diphosphocytidyl-2-C-methyl-D-erythritol kinase